MVRSMKRDNGFTLIEVVVAMAILAIALTMAISLFGGSLRSAATVSSYSDAVVVAREKMDEVLCCADVEFKKFDEGTSGPFAWTRKIEPFTADGEEVEGLVRVEVSVSWPSGGRAKEVRFESLLYKGKEGAA